MKKIVIPAILAATILVAGMFALMPVEKASTVHATIQGTQLQPVSKYVTTAVTTATTVIDLSSSKPFEAKITIFSSGGSALSVFTVDRITGATVTAGTVTNGVVTTAGSFTGGTTTALGTMSLTAPTQFVLNVSGGAGDVIKLRISTAGAGVSVTAAAVYLGQSGATFI